MDTSCPWITSRVPASTPGWPKAALMPNGLLLSGGMDAPHALSTTHCASVMEAGTFHRTCDAVAALAMSGGTCPTWPNRGEGLLASTSGRAARE